MTQIACRALIGLHKSLLWRSGVRHDDLVTADDDVNYLYYFEGNGIGFFLYGHELDMPLVISLCA